MSESSSGIVGSFDVTTPADEADANDNDRMVDGVEEVVESKELRNCRVDRNGRVSCDNCLLMSEFAWLAINTARKEYSIEVHSVSASSRSFNSKMVNTTIADESRVVT